jgi:hypothetical protein
LPLEAEDRGHLSSYVRMNHIIETQAGVGEGGIHNEV